MEEKRFVKKNLGGYRECPGGYSDPECTHVIITRDEYSELIDNITWEKSKRINAESEAEKKIKKAIEQAEQKIKTNTHLINQEYSEKVADLELRLEEAEWDVNTQKNLNRNLLRIMRERANAKRGILNKKEHLGYIVMNSRQYNQKYKEYSSNKTVFKEVITWKTTIQTPYDASVPINQIKGEIFEDLVHRGVLAELRVQQYSSDKALKGGGEYTVFKDDEGRIINGIYNTQYNANYKSGFWEIDIFHTKSIAVPVEMRPPQRN